MTTAPVRTGAVATPKITRGRRGNLGPPHPAPSGPHFNDRGDRDAVIP